MRRTNLKWLFTLITVISFAFYGNAQVIFQDDFSTDQGWTMTGSWTRDAAVAEPTTDHSGDGNILANPLGIDYDNNMVREEVTSPIIDCSTYTSTDSIVLYFWSFSGCESNSFDHMGIEVYDGTSWVSIWSNGSSFQEIEWTNRIMGVTQYAAGNANFQVRYYMGTTDGSVTYSGFAIDDFMITNITCNQPTNQNALNITVNSATLNWISGGASNYNFVYGPQGFNMADSTAIALTDTFYNVAGLTPETTYEFYVQDDCGGGDVSLWTGPYSFTTLISCPAPTNQDVINITINSATFTWITGGANNWNVIYGPQGFNMNDSTAIATTDTFYNVAGLTPETTYEYYVQDSCGTGDASHWVGPYPFTTLISCPAPTSQDVINITTTGATFTWVSGGASNWNIVYGPLGFNMADSTAIASTDTFYNATNLNAATTYEFYVQDSCGTGDVSQWVGPYSFTTECDAISTFPWIESFENAGVIPNCWTNIPSADNDLWQFTIPSSAWGTAEYGPAGAGDHTSGSGYIAWIDDSQTPIANPTVLETPVFDLTSLTSPQFIFWYWIGVNTNTSSLRVDIFDGTTWHNNIDSLTNNGQWDKVTLDIAAYSSTATKVRFTAYESNVSSSYQSDIAIDDIEIREAPTCLEPTDLSVSDLTATTAQLNWVPAVGQSNWNVEWDTTGFAQGTGNFVSVTDTFVNITGLTPGVTYQYYVQADCGSGDLSYWSGPYSFKYLIGDNCMSIQDLATLTSPYNATTTGYTANDIPGMTCTNADNGSASRIFSIDINPGEELHIGQTSNTFDSRHSLSYGSTCPGDTAIACVDDPDTQEETWVNNTNDVQTLYFIVAGYSSSSQGDFVLEWYVITCPDPTNLGVTNLSNTDADLTWDANLATTWDIEFGTSGFAPTGIPTYDDVTSNPYNVSGLTPETNYEFYVREVCAVDDTSNWVGPFQFTTLADCPVPTDLAVSGITTSSADLSWNGYFASTWDIEIDTAGFIPTGIPTYNDVVNDTFNVTSLLSGTAYEFYVRADCGTDTSDWVGPFNFSTLCDAVTSYPYIESFETGDYSDCWSQTASGTGLIWSVLTSGTSPTVSPYDGAYLAKLNCYSASTGETRLSTVNFDLTGQTTPHLDFFMIHDNGYSSSDDRIIVQITTDGTTWIDIDTISRYQNISATWTEYNYDLSSYIGQTIAIGFYGITEYGNNIFIDKVMISNQTSDLSVINPDNQDYTSCHYTGTDTIPLHIKNTGSTPIAANETINAWYEYDGGAAVAETFVLSSNLMPSDTAFFNFSQTVDFTGGNAHTVKVYIEYTGDTDATNDTTNSTFTHQNPTISINQGDTMLVASSDFPKILSVGNTFESYFWYNEDSTVTGTNVQLVINHFGTYVINATDANGCVASDTIYVIDITNVELLQNVNINVYPNPNNGEFTLNANFNTAIDITVDMININGKTIYSKEFNGIKTLNEQIDVDGYAKGIYYIRISNNNFVKQEKVVIY